MIKLSIEKSSSLELFFGHPNVSIHNLRDVSDTRFLSYLQSSFLFLQRRLKSCAIYDTGLSSIIKALEDQKMPSLSVGQHWRKELINILVEYDLSMDIFRQSDYQLLKCCL